MKQAIVVRTDLQMSAGKLVVQACHASVAPTLRVGVDVLKGWETDGQTKIALAAHSLSELEKLKKSVRVRGDCPRNDLRCGTY